MTIWPSVNLYRHKKDPDALIPGVQTAQSFQTMIGLRNVTGTLLQPFLELKNSSVSFKLIIGFTNKR